MRSRRLPRPVLIGAALLAAVPVVLACKPFLPNWLLEMDAQLFAGPWGTFAGELKRLQSGDRPPFKAVPSEDAYEDEVLAAEKADLERALEAHGTWPMLRGSVVESVLRLRQSLAPRRPSLEEMLQFGLTKPGPAPTGLSVPKPLLPEFADYLEGAIAFHDGRPRIATAAWERLLARPPQERRFRSTWAAFMLGKLHLRSDPERAVKSFRRTRELASQGFADTLGLAASSLGWEAWAEADRERYDRALPLYAQQMRAGDPGAFNSLKLASAAALRSGPKALEAVARDPEARAILTAWLVSHELEPRDGWQQALEAADVRDVAGADRLAWAAYLAGNVPGARTWLDRAQEQTPIARWVRARLLLYDGKLDEARKLLAEAAQDLPDPGLDMEEAQFLFYSTEEVLATPQRALGEEAALRATQRDYTGALDGLLRTGYWMDAAWLAEQVLTLDELKTYVDATWPADLAVKYVPPQGKDAWEPLLVGGYTSPPLERLARDVRYLLGRRLVREGRRREAVPYLPAERRADLERLAGHLEAGRDRKRRAAERGRELFQAACLVRDQGLELTGTEVDPDWKVVDGEYEVQTMTFGSREARRRNRVLRATPDETARVKRHRAQPWKRYHYRYGAADLAWEAAALLPSGDEKAALLATAGSWLGARDPQAADRFYKQLVRCCGTTGLGREADELRWFPQADACPMENDPQ